MFNRLSLSTRCTIGQIAVATVLFYSVVTLLRLMITPSEVNLMMQQGYLIASTIAFAVAGFAKGFRLKPFLWVWVATVLYASVLYLKKADGMIVLDRETVHTVTFGSVGAALFVMATMSGIFLKNSFLRGSFRLLASVLMFLFICIPLLFWGYFIVSGGHLLSADIILTLFQTNPDEARAYLDGQNKLLWSVCILILLFLPMLASILFYRSVELYSPPPRNLYATNNSSLRPCRSADRVVCSWGFTET